MKKIIASLLIFTGVLVSQYSRAQDVSINIGNAPSVALGSSTPILVSVCNEDPNPIDAPANKLRPQVSVPGNVIITGVTNTDGSPLTGWTILSQTTGTVRLLNQNPLPNGECFEFHVVVQGTVISGATNFNGTLGFQGPQTPGNNIANDNSISSIAVTAPVVVPPVAVADNAANTAGQPVVIPVLTNDTPGSAAIDPTSVKLIDPVSGLPVTTVTIAGEGTYTVDAVTGNVTFTPDPALTTAVTSTVRYTVSDVNGVTSNQATITINVTPLPVTLVSFTAKKEGTVAILNWATTQEANSDRFEIEQSLNGKVWNRIGKVESSGESKVLIKYSFTDVNPVAGSENLYRLKMIDNDETFAYSRIQSVKFDGIQADLTVYPNPVSDKLFIRDFAQVSQVNIYDLKGVSVYQSGSSKNGEITVSNLPTGVYTVRITRSNGLQNSQKIVVKK
jgi:CshA-type fibril repeat protein